MKKLLSAILAMVMVFSLAVPAMAWDSGYKEVAITVDTAEAYDEVLALQDGFDYIETRDNADGTVDVVFHIRTQEEQDYLENYNLTVITDSTPRAVRTFSAASAASSAPEDGLRFEVNADGWIVGIPIGDSAGSVVPAGSSVWPDVMFDYEGLGVTFNETYGFPNRLGYRTVTEYYSEMNYLAENYPHLVKLHNMGYSWYGRPMYVLEICDQPGVEDGRPEWLHLAATHAREWPANELSLNNAWWFVTEYDKYLKGEQNVDSRVIDVMQNVRSWITPLHNPDGTHWDQTAGNSQRKNRRPGATPAPFGQRYFGATTANIAAGSLGAANYIGSDLNRNWCYRWGSSDGSSIWNQTSESTNRGMGPGSEPENVALTGFMRNRMIGSDISGHTSGDLVIFPWSNKKGAAEDTGVMDFVALGRELASYNGYTDYHERVIYSQSGEGQEYMYGGYRALGFTVEMGQSFKPNYLGVTSGHATASFNDRNPNVGARKVPINYAASTRPTEAMTYPMAFLLPPADPDGAYPAQTTFVPTYSHQNWRTRVSYLQAELDKDPDFVNGKILVCYNAEGTTGNTQHDIAYFAQQHGAKGVLFCTIPSGIAPNSSHGFLGAPSINGTGTTGTVTIPVGGTFRMYARELLEYTRDGHDWGGNLVVNSLTLESDATRRYNPFSWYWERNAYMYVQLAEYAKDYAGHIKGEVVGSDGNAVPGANLNLTKDVYLTQLAEQVTDQVFWDPKTHTGGNEGPASTASAANTKPDWKGVDWALYAPWGYEGNVNLDPALVNHYEDIQAWFKANPPKSRYYDDLVPYKNLVTGDTFQTIVEEQTGYMEIQNDDGSFDWSVVPSQQFETYAYEGRNQPNWPGGNTSNQGRGTANSFEVDSPDDSRIGKYIYNDEGYEVVAKAPGYYDSAPQAVFVENYKVVKDNVNFEIQEAITSDFTFDVITDASQDITVLFSTYNLVDGASVKGDVNGVYAAINGIPVPVTSLGNGDYSATFNLKKLNLTLEEAYLVIDFASSVAHSPLTFGEAPDSEGNLKLTTNAHRITDGDYFTLNAAFTGEMNSNTAILNYSFNADLFEYANFTAADGVTVVDRQFDNTLGTAKITVMVQGGYGITNFGDIMLLAKADQTNSRETVSVVVEYVVKGADNTKIIKTAGAAASFLTVSNDPIEGFDTNFDGVIDLIDLSNMIDWFGYGEAYFGTYEWNYGYTYSRFDVNHDGYIGIFDIAHVANLIK